MFLKRSICLFSEIRTNIFQNLGKDLNIQLQSTMYQFNSLPPTHSPSPSPDPFHCLQNLYFIFSTISPLFWSFNYLYFRILICEKPCNIYTPILDLFPLEVWSQDSTVFLKIAQTYPYLLLSGTLLFMNTTFLISM